MPAFCPFRWHFSRIFARAFHCSVLAHFCASCSFRLMLGFRVYIVHFSRIFARAFHHPFLAHFCASLSSSISRASLREPFIVPFSRIFARASAVAAYIIPCFRVTGDRVTPSFINLTHTRGCIYFRERVSPRHPVTPFLLYFYWRLPPPNHARALPIPASCHD